MITRLLGVLATTIALTLVPAVTQAGAPAVGSVIRPADDQESMVESVPLDTVDPDGAATPDVLEEALDDPARPAVDAPVEVEDAAPGEQALTALSAPVPVGHRDLALVGVSWLAAPESVRVDVRSLSRGAWSRWTPVDVDVDGEQGEGGRGGSEPYLVVDVEEVQVRLHVAQGDPEVQDAELFVYAASATAEDAELGAVLPTVAGPDPTEPSVITTALYRPDAGGTVTVARTSLLAPAAVVLTDPEAPTTDPVDGVSPGTATPATTVVPALAGHPPGTVVQAPRPTVAPRSAWGAVAPTSALATAKVQGAVVHHTAGSNTYTAEQVPSILRGIQRYHMESRGWSDIGYNMLVDKWGRLWEGRHGSLERSVQGVHAAGYNSLSFGISVMGNYVDVTPSAAVVDSLSRAIAWRLAASNVLADGRYTSGLPAIIGHRDVSQTACPGRIQNQLGTIRSKARALQTIVEPQLPRTMMLRDTRANGLPEVLRWDATGVVVTEADPLPVASGLTVGSNWTIVDQAAIRPATGRDDVPDLIARIASTGDLFAYHGDGKGAFTGRTKIGRGWGVMSHILAPGDWNRDGVDDLLAVRRSDGALLLYAGRSTGGFSAPVQVAQGWGSFVSVTAPGDIDGDGRPDLVVVDRDARILLYPGTAAGGLGPVRHLATADRGTDFVVGAADLNQDGHRDLLTRASGRMTTWHGRPGAAVVRGTTWGSGWGAMAPVVPAENWSAPGRAALLGASAKTGRMYLYVGQPAGAMRTTSRPAISTTGVDALFLVGDVRGDGTADVLTRRTDGRLMLHESTASGAWRDPVQVGRGWGVFDVVTAAGDVDGDGVPDVLVRERTTGNLRVYPMRRDGSFKSPFTVATGLAGQQVVAVGGWTSTSSADVVTVDPATGAASLRRGRGAFSLAAPVALGTIAKGQQLVGAGDFRRTGHNDLLAMDSSGRLWLYPGSSAATVGPRIAVGGIRPGGTGALS